MISYFGNSQRAYYSRFVRPQSMKAAADESKGLPASAAEASAVKTFGDLPLIVLTGWQEWQTELLQLSSDSQQLYAEKSGHTVHIDEPDAAVAAILQMVGQVRGTVKK